jgi:Fe2+ transport system protein B
MYSFSASKAYCCCNPDSKVPKPLNTLKKGKVYSGIFTMNRFNVAILPISLCTSFLDYGGFMQTIAFILSRFASIPLTEIK